MSEFLNYLITGLVSGSAYVMVALGLTLVFGILEILHFAHGEVFMLGAYFAWTILRFFEINYLLAVVLSMIIGGGLGILIEYFCIRPLRGKPLFLPVITTVGLSFIFTDAARVIWSADPQIINTGFNRSIVHVGDIFISQQRILMFVISVISIGLLYLFIHKTFIGKAMRAASMDLETTSLMGINTNIIIGVTFALGSALAAGAGALLGPIFLLVPHMGTLMGMKAFVCVILGGFGDVRGTILAGFIIGITESLTVGYLSSQLKDASTFFVLIMVLFFRPSGLFGTKSGKYY